MTRILPWILVLAGCPEVLRVAGGPIPIETRLDIDAPIADIEYGLVVVTDGACNLGESADELGTLRFWSRFFPDTPNENEVTLDPGLDACVRVFAVRSAPANASEPCTILGVGEESIVSGETEAVEVTVGTDPTANARFERLVCPPQTIAPFDGFHAGPAVSFATASTITGRVDDRDRPRPLEVDLAFGAGTQPSFYCARFGVVGEADPTVVRVNTGEDDVVHTRLPPAGDIEGVQRWEWSVRTCYHATSDDDPCPGLGDADSGCTAYSTRRNFITGSPSIDRGIGRAGDIAIGAPTANRFEILYGSAGSCADALNQDTVEVGLPDDACEPVRFCQPNMDAPDDPSMDSCGVFDSFFGDALAFANLAGDETLEIVVSASICSLCPPSGCTGATPTYRFDDPAAINPTLGALFVFNGETGREISPLRSSLTDLLSAPRGSLGPVQLRRIRAASRGSFDNLVVGYNTGPTFFMGSDVGSFTQFGIADVQNRVELLPPSPAQNGRLPNGYGDLTGDGLPDFVMGDFLLPFGNERLEVPQPGVHNAIGPDVDGDGISEWYQMRTCTDCPGMEQLTLSRRRVRDEGIESEPFAELEATLSIIGNGVNGTDTRRLLAIGSTGWTDTPRPGWLVTTQRISEEAGEVVLLPTDAPEDAIRLPVEDAGGEFGTIISSTDLNADLWPDIVITSPSNQQVYVVCGGEPPALRTIFQNDCIVSGEIGEGACARGAGLATR
ncbi:MAG: hypothetical protein AAGE52_27220 [Myxococcota bacterium]